MIVLSQMIVHLRLLKISVLYYVYWKTFNQFKIYVKLKAHMFHRLLLKMPAQFKSDYFQPNLSFNLQIFMLNKEL